MLASLASNSRLEQNIFTKKASFASFLVEGLTLLGVQSLRILCMISSANFNMAKVVGATAPTLDRALLPLTNET